MTKTAKILLYCILYSLILWSLVPLLRHSLPMDTQEAIVWGKYCLWGTTKHPPFSGWVAYLFYWLSGRADGIMYFLSQLCIALGLVYIYKLAYALLKNPQSALVAALLQFGVIYYHFSAVEFNVNVISIALWPMCAFYFWQAYTKDSLKDWLLFGLLTGINLLNKYVSGVLLVSLAVFVLADKNALRLLKNPKVYAGAAVAMAVLAPHLYWLYQNDFESFYYISTRSSGGKMTSAWRHLVYPLKFIAAQIMFCAAGWLTYWVFYRQAKISSFSLKSVFVSKSGTEQRTSLFILLTALLPIGIFSGISLINGHALKSMWGFPFLFMFGILLVHYVPLNWTPVRLKKFVGTMLVWSTLFAAGYAVQCLVTKSQRFTSQCPQIASALEQEWHQKMPDLPLKYVGGDVWYADMLNLYAPSAPKPMIWLNPKNNPWFNVADFEQSGALVVCENIDEYKHYQHQYPHRLSQPRQMRLEFKNYFGKTKPKEVFYGFYLPEEVKYE